MGLKCALIKLVLGGGTFVPGKQNGLHQIDGVGPIKFCRRAFGEFWAWGNAKGRVFAPAGVSHSFQKVALVVPSFGVPRFCHQAGDDVA